jgi:hypothetical protein
VENLEERKILDDFICTLLSHARAVATSMLRIYSGDLIRSLGKMSN